HDAVEGARVVVEHQRQEAAVAFPQRQVEDALDLHPLQRAFRVGGERLARVTRHQEEKPQPVLAVLAEAGPADRAAQLQLLALDPGFPAALAPHAGHHLLTAFTLATPSVVLAQTLAAGARVAMDHQPAPPIRRKPVAGRGSNGRARHAWSVRPR